MEWTGGGSTMGPVDGCRYGGPKPTYSWSAVQVRVLSIGPGPAHKLWDTDRF